MGVSIQSDSQNDVVTTVAHFAIEFARCIRDEMPKVAVVHDEKLSYETALKKIRENDDFRGSETDALPMFVYKRNVLRKNEDRMLGRRAVGKRGCITIDGTPIQYNVHYGEIEILFAYYTKDVELLEKFEVVYNSDIGISEIKEVVVNMAELGDFSYFLEWGDLEDLSFEEDDNHHYKAVAGSLKARGFFFTFSGEMKVIKEINANILSSMNLGDPGFDETLSNCLIK